MSAAQSRVPRRSGADSRELLVSAARRLFGEHGYAGTGTRDIAAEAGVPERLIFRHFGGKRELFDQAASAEVSDYLDDFVDAWSSLRPTEYDLRSLTRRYVVSFSEFTRRHRRLLVDLIALHGVHSDPVRESSAMSPFVDLLNRLEILARTEAERYDLPTDRAQTHVRFTFALVMATVLLDDVLYRSDQKLPTDAGTVDELTAFILGGALEDRQP